MDGLEICTEVVLAGRAFDPSGASRRGWQYSSSGERNTKEGKTYTSVTIQNAIIQLQIRHFENQTKCTTVAPVKDPEQASKLVEMFREKWNLNLHDEGKRKNEVVEAERRAWGSIVGIETYDLYYSDSLIYPVRTAIVEGQRFLIIEINKPDPSNIHYVPEKQN